MIAIFGTAEAIMPSFPLKLIFVNLYEVADFYHFDPSKWQFYVVQLNSS